jgi:hypothetical protein
MILVKTWDSPKQFSAPRNEARNIAIGQDGNGNLIGLIARATNKIYIKCPVMGVTVVIPHSTPGSGWLSNRI